MEFPTGGTAREPKGMIRCDYGADRCFIARSRRYVCGIVWMEEESHSILSVIMFDVHEALSFYGRAFLWEFSAMQIILRRVPQGISFLVGFHPHFLKRKVPSIIRRLKTTDIEVFYDRS